MVNKDGLIIFNRLYGSEDRTAALAFAKTLEKVFSSVERVYVLTELGKKSSQTMSPRGRDEVIDHIYSHQTARLSELASMMGVDERVARGKLKRYTQRGLVQELTH